MITKLTDEQQAGLAQELCRCSPETLAAAIRFREQGDATTVPTIVYGLIERYQPATSPLRLADASDQTRLTEDLGLDSLTLLELVMSIEEVLQVRIGNEELKGIHTLGQLKQFLPTKIRAAQAPS